MDSSCFIRPFPVIQGCFGSGIPCVVPVSVYHAHHMGRQRQQICTTRVIHCKITHGIAVRTVLRDDMPCKAQLLRYAPHTLLALGISASARPCIQSCTYVSCQPCPVARQIARTGQSPTFLPEGFGLYHTNITTTPLYRQHTADITGESVKKRAKRCVDKKRHTYTVCLFSALRPSAIFLYAVRRRRFTPSTDTFIRNACSTQLRPRTSHSAIHCTSSCGKSKDWIHAIALLGVMLCSIARISRCA